MIDLKIAVTRIQHFENNWNWKFKVILGKFFIFKTFFNFSSTFNY